MAGFSDYAEKKILDHVFGKASWASPTGTGLYLALLTVAPVDADTGATITEANYTGYVRKQIVPADMSSAAGVLAEIHNTVAEAFANCTAGNSTIIGWALLDSSGTGTGNMIVSGSAASTVISATQTPATIPASALSTTLD